MSFVALDPSLRILQMEGGALKKVAGIKTPVQIADEAKHLVGQITQGSPDDIQSATRALKELNTQGVSTYDDLVKLINDKMKTLGNAQDELLGKVPLRRKIADFVQTTGEGTARVSKNYVDDAFKHLEELYDSTGDIENLSRIRKLKQLANTKGLTVQELNGIAKEYGSEFSTKAFNPRTGDPLTSVNAKLAENTRSALKQQVRSIIPDESSKMLDTGMSDLMDLRRMAESVQQKTFALQNKLAQRGLIERIGRMTGKGIDLATGHILRGLFTSMFQGNIGLKQLNYVDIQSRLAKNLVRLDKLLKKLDSVSDESALRIIQKDLGISTKGGSKDFPELTVKEISELTKEEKALGMTGGSDFVDDAAKNVESTVAHSKNPAVIAQANRFAQDVLQSVAKSLKTTPDELAAIVKSAGNDGDAINASLQKAFGKTYETFMKEAVDEAVKTGKLGGVDIIDPIRQAVFGIISPQ